MRLLSKLTFAAIFIALPCLAGSAMACSCFPLPPPYEAVKGAKAVFVGKVLSSNVPLI